MKYNGLIKQDHNPWKCVWNSASLISKSVCIVGIICVQIALDTTVYIGVSLSEHISYLFN